MAAFTSFLRNSSLVLSVMLLAPTDIFAADNSELTTLLTPMSNISAQPETAPAPAQAVIPSQQEAPAAIPTPAPVTLPVVQAADPASPPVDAPPVKKFKKKKPLPAASQDAVEPAEDDMAEEDESERDYMGNVLIDEVIYNLPVIKPKLPSLSEITLERAIGMALKNSPERDVAAAQTNQAHYAVDEAKAGYYPQVNLRAEADREYNDPFALRAGATTYSGRNYGTEQDVDMRMMLFDGFSTRETVKQRLQLVESANLSSAKVSEELITFTTQVYMDLWHFQSLNVASKQNLDTLTEIGALIDKRVLAGDASKVEQNYIQARLSAAQKDYLTVQASLKDAFSALTYLIGDVKEFPAEPPDPNAYKLPDVNALMQKAVEQNTDMRLLASDKAATEHELKAAEGKYMPTVDLVADGSHSIDLGGFTGLHQNASVGIQVNYKLFDGGLRKATTNREIEKLREINAKEERTLRDIKQNVRKSYNRLETVLEQMKVVDSEILANSDLEKLYRKQFEQGELEFIQLVESQERIFTAQTKKIQLETDLVNTTFDLMRATSDLLPTFCGNANKC